MAKRKPARARKATAPKGKTKHAKTAKPARKASKRHPNVGDDQPTDQPYPKVLYAKNADGTLTDKTVADAAAEKALRAEDPSVVWETNPGDHGVETAPAAEAK